MDIATLGHVSEEARGAARNAVAVSDSLVIALAQAKIEKFWPGAESWTREYVAYDDMPGGDWYLVDVVVEGRKVLDTIEGRAVSEDWIEELDNLLADIYESGEHNEQRERLIEG